MKYLSICSGVESASLAWQPLGWTPVAFAEIEPFPSAVLSHHWPDVPNLGDITKFKTWPDYADLDLIVGGTPCQAFSVAGLRRGLRDPRGNLTLTFLGVTDRYQPRFVVWENVPGVLSDSTRALHYFLDGLNEIGYAIIGFDVLDARFFGVPQRRRRVFVCAQRIDDLLNRRTISSGLIVAQCLAEILRDTLNVLRGLLNPEVENSNSVSTESMASLWKKMRLFLHPKAGPALTWLGSLDALLPSSECVPFDSGWLHGKTADPHPRIAAMPSEIAERGRTVKTEGGQNTESSWKSTLVEAFQIASECITLTASNQTTESRIFTCAKAMILIARSMRESMASSPSFCNAAASILTGLGEFTNYARCTSTDLFGDVGRLCGWHDFVREAEFTEHALGNIRVRSFGAVLPISQSLSGDSSKSREKRQDVAPTISARTKGGGRLGSDFDLDGGLISSTGETSRCLNAGGMGRQDFETETLIAHSLRAQSQSAHDHTLETYVAFTCKDHGADAGALSPTLRSMGHATSHANAGGQVAVAFQEAQTGVREYEYSGSLRANGPGHDPVGTRLRLGGAVRRLTPLECERLMGFPDGHTLVPSKIIAKLGVDPDPENPNHWAKDGPRYKACGNSIVVPCLRWIGERIEAVEAI